MKCAGKALFDIAHLLIQPNRTSRRRILRARVPDCSGPFVSMDLCISSDLLALFESLSLSQHLELPGTAC